MKQGKQLAKPPVKSATAEANCCILSYTCIYLTTKGICICKNVQCGKTYNQGNGTRLKHSFFSLLYSLSKSTRPFSKKLTNSGEQPGDALQREVREELGVTDFTPTFIMRYVFESAIEKELVNTFKTIYNGPFSPDPEELDEGKFWSLEEIESNLGKGIFTPNFESEYKRLKKECL